MPEIAFATFADLPELDPDDRPVAAELARRKVTVQAAVWSDPAVDWTRFELVVLRSCWDYDRTPGAFLAWLDALDAARVRVANPTRAARWNLDKRHLCTLAARDLPVIETAWFEAGDPVTLAAALERLGGEQAVVKPVISMNSNGTWRASLPTSPTDEARWRAQVDVRPMMVQRFRPEILDTGEWSLIFLGGRFSHACRKLPATGDFRVQSQFGGRRELVSVDTALIRHAERVLAIAGEEAGAEEWLYARVDGVRVEGRFELMELELIDPSLYLAKAPGSAATFASAIHATLAR